MPDINKILNHDIQINRLENNLLNTVITPNLGETLKQIRRIIADIEDVTSIRALRRLEREVERTIKSQSGWAAATAEMQEFAEVESQFYATLTGAGATAAQAERIQRLANTTMLVLRSGDRFDTGLWSDFVAGNEDAQIKRVNSAIRAGYAQGMTVREMRRQIEALYDGVLAREVETLARTGFTHFATVGRRAFVDANKDIIAREVPVVTFDSRLSDTCASISARYGIDGWPAGKSPIGYAPYHHRCRTTIVPLAKGQSLTGERTARGAEGGSRIDAKTTVDDFFRQQPREWLEETLGASRAQLFIDGKLELRNLTNAKLKPLTLKKIRQSI